MSRNDESVSNLYIVNDPIQLGGPFGIFAAPCEATLLEGFSDQVDILAEFPGRGDLLQTLRHKLSLYAIQKDMPWFETTMNDILWHVGELLDDAFRAERVSHFEAMVE